VASPAAESVDISAAVTAVDTSGRTNIQLVSATLTDDSEARLNTLLAIADTSSPVLRRMQQHVAAANAKAVYADKLPDPTVAAGIFIQPIETAAGSQRANLTIRQMLPWLERLDAQQQQACFETMAIQQDYQVKRTEVIADIRRGWYQLYVINQQIDSTAANQQLLKSLIDLANANVATGKSSSGDVLLGTLEYSKLEERLLILRQQQKSTVAELNRRIGRAIDTPISPPTQLDVQLPDHTLDSLTAMAHRHQPEIAAAHIRTQASRWGVEVARLQKRPEFGLTASWFEINGNRPATPVVAVGEDAWSLGAQISVPVWSRDYAAMEQEALWQHAAAHSTVEETIRNTDSRLRDLWEQAIAADAIVSLYQSTIIPQAHQTLEADQQSYVNGSTDFDRVIRDFRNVLSLELEQRQAQGRLATALAGVEQATGHRIR